MSGSVPRPSGSSPPSPYRSQAVEAVIKGMWGSPVDAGKWDDGHQTPSTAAPTPTLPLERSLDSPQAGRAESVGAGDRCLSSSDGARGSPRRPAPSRPMQPRPETLYDAEPDRRPKTSAGGPRSARGPAGAVSRVGGSPLPQVPPRAQTSIDACSAEEDDCTLPALPAAAAKRSPSPDSSPGRGGSRQLEPRPPQEPRSQPPSSARAAAARRAAQASADQGRGGGPAASPAQSPRAQPAEESQSLWPKDPCLISVAKRLAKALIGYYKRQPVKSGAISWARFFDECYPASLAGITFAELDQAARDKLRADVSRYELRVFWRRLDADGSGQATIPEFTRVMYIIEMSTWPDLTPEEVDRTVQTLSDAAEKWYRAGGNWFKIFSTIDFDDSGALSYDELRQCIRSVPPGLRLKESDLSERCLQGLWKLLDNEADIEIPVYRFMSFMRKHSNASIHRITSYSAKKRGIEQAKEAAPEAPKRERSSEELRGIVREIEQYLVKYYTAKGVRDFARPERTWNRFFREIDADNSDRLTYFELRDALHSKKLRKVANQAVTFNEDDLTAFWELIDPDRSGEASWSEMALALYRLEVDAWPDEDDAAMKSVATELSEALKRRFHTGGNWFKAFTIVDKDSRGRVRYPEFKELVRDTWKGLAVKTEQISEKRLKACWKRLDTKLSGDVTVALDTTRSGDVTVAEFMVFMRRFGAHQSKRTRGLLEESRQDHSEAIANAPRFGEQAMGTIAMRLSLAVNNWLFARGVRQNLHSQQLWAVLLGFVSNGRTCRINFAELSRTVRNLLNVPEVEVSDDELRAFWREVDADGTGEATPGEFDRAVYRLQIEMWPKLQDDQLKAVVGQLSAAAEKWHRAGGNWYKVFTACDEEGSGNMGFQELCRIVRKTFPGLSISTAQISDNDLRGFWRALDADHSGLVSVREFMVFMRTHGKEFSMHRSTTYSLKMRGELPEVSQTLGDPPERTRDELRAISTRLDEAMVRYWRRKCVATGASSRVSAMWERFFEEANASLDEKTRAARGGRLAFFDLERSLRDCFIGRPKKDSALPWERSSPQDSSDKARLAANSSSLEGNSRLDSVDKGLVAEGVTYDDLHALWAHVVDTKGSGGVTAKDWLVRNHHLQLEVWPSMTEQQLSTVVDTISAAADKWHRAGGNWYKVFRLCDTENSGRMSFEVMLDIIRRPLPGLAIPATRAGEREWRAGSPGREAKSSPPSRRESRAGSPGKEAKGSTPRRPERESRRGASEKETKGCLSDKESKGCVSDQELKGLWKAMFEAKQMARSNSSKSVSALDVDQSGDVSVTEFMVFMRKLEHQRGISHSPKAAAGSIVHRARTMDERKASANTDLSSKDVGILRMCLDNHSLETFEQAYADWELPWEGMVSEWDFHRVIRKLLRVPEDLLDDLAIYAAWCALDPSASGVVRAQAVLDLGR